MAKTASSRHIIMVVTIVMAAGFATAQEGNEAADSNMAQVQTERLWYLRLGVVAVDTNSPTLVVTGPATVEAQVGAGGGGSISFERRISPTIGLEFGVTGVAADMSVSSVVDLKHIGTEVELLGMGVLTFGANFHLVGEGHVDVYAGPFVALNRYDKLSVWSGVDDDWWPWDPYDDWVAVRTKSDSEVTWGAKAGLDVLLGKKKRWTLGCSLGYIDATYSFEPERGEQRYRVDLDPVMFSFGAGFRF